MEGNHLACKGGFFYFMHILHVSTHGFDIEYTYYPNEKKACTNYGYSHDWLNTKKSLIMKLILKIGSLSRQEPQPAGTTEWATTLNFFENLKNNFRCKKYTESTKYCQM